MKITGVETLFGRWLAVKIHTDEGITGVSGTHSVGRIDAVKTAIEMLEPHLKGKDPFRVEHHWEAMYVDPCWRGSIMSAAIAAVDVALWDIVGKSLGVPIYRLMGGPTRDKVKLVASTGGATTEEAVKNAERAVKDGFKAVRITPFGPTFQTLGHTALIREAVKQVKAVREAIGDDVDLAVECLTRLRPYEAIALGKELEKYRILFYEDPVLWENVETLAEIQAHVNIPVATGERLYSLYEFRDLLNHKASQIIRPDVLVAGGLTNSRKIAALAQASYVDLVPHNPSARNGILCAVNAHFCASVNNVVALEYAYGVERPYGGEVQQPLEVKDGYLMLPEKPGLGIELNEESIKEGPPMAGAIWQRYCLRDDGGVWHN
ncbi:MAG: mandelate racemase/muconate lactonizing enzyme family protein [Candidatus Bathyarchaeia archaeon]